MQIRSDFIFSIGLSSRSELRSLKVHGLNLDMLGSTDSAPAPVFILSALSSLLRASFRQSLLRMRRVAKAQFMSECKLNLQVCIHASLLLSQSLNIVSGVLSGLSPRSASSIAPCPLYLSVTCSVSEPQRFESYFVCSISEPALSQSLPYFRACSISELGL